MKSIYISHPLRGSSWRENIEKAGSYCRKYTDEDKELLPVSPLHALGFHDPNTYDPDHGMALCMALLDMCDEIWVHGAWENSVGCRLEIIHAWKKGIPVKFVTEEAPE